MEQAKFAYSLLGKPFGEQWKKQVEALEVLDPKKIKKCEEQWKKILKNSERNKLKI